MMKSFPTEAIDALAGHYEADEIWLLGSRARGDARPDSDWDVLVLSRGENNRPTRSVAGNDHLGQLGMAGDVHLVSSDVFHSSSRVANSISRTVGEDRVLLYRRDGFEPRFLSYPEAKRYVTEALRRDGGEYLAAAALLRGAGYGRLNLFRLASRDIMLAILTDLDIHLGCPAFRPGGLSLALRSLPYLHQSQALIDGISLLETAEAHSVGDDPEAIIDPTNAAEAVLSRFEPALYRLNSHSTT